MTPEEHAERIRAAVRMHVAGGGEQHLEALLELASTAWHVCPVYGPDASGWRLEHVCGWHSNMQDNSRSLADLARWISVHECEPANRPTGFATRKAWSTIPAGWFVCVPGKRVSWWEVRRTVRDGAVQQVTLRDQHGREGTWPRDPEQVIKVRRGTSPGTSEVTEAIELFGGEVSILRDSIDG